jgi:Cu2+-exporting ATPase
MNDHHEHMIADFRRRFWISTAVSIPILALSPLIQEVLGLREALAFPGDSYVLLALSSLVYFYGGWPFLTGFVSEMRDRSPGMMTLIAVAITTAYSYSAAVVFGLSGEVFFWELATLVDVMLAGHWIEMRSVAGASRALEELAKLMPKDAHRIADDGSVEDVPLDELARGDRVRVKPGEKIPADGKVVEGTTSVNEAMLTGESRPVPKEEGDEVIGGSVNAEGSIVVEVTHTGDESFLSQVIGLVESAQASRSKTQNLADRAAFWLTIIALAAGALTFIAWEILLRADTSFALARTVTVMVITCPHALGLAIPLVVSMSTSVGARSGLLIRERDAFERARNVDAVLFDKTGTLTLGEFGVRETVAWGDRDQHEVLRLAAAVEANSEHPIAAGIVRAVENPPSSSEFEAIPGKGARGRVDGTEVVVASPAYVAGRDLDIPDRQRVDELSERGDTVVFVVAGDELVGVIALGDEVRDESKQAVSRLKEMGVSPMMLTGDSEDVAAAVASELGIEEYFAEVLPQGKADKVEEVRSAGRIVAMTGDGVNDAPALATADVGIAVGAGTDVAVETADIVLVRSDPRDVVRIVELSEATYRKMIQNLWWAAGYNILAIPLAAGVLYGVGIVLSPAVGAALMSLSTVIVAINARLLKLPEVEE